MLEFKRFNLKADTSYVLKDINLRIGPAEFVILIGHNGSGKSSLLKAIAGNYKTSAETLQMRTCKMAYLNQDYNRGVCSDLSIKEHAIMVRHCFGTSLDSQLPKDLQKATNLLGYQLSGGQKQVLGLSIAMCKRPDLLLLDEHTSALDPQMAQICMKLTFNFIQTHKTTAIMATHNLDHALEYGTRIIMLKGGRLISDIAGEEKKALTKDRLLSLYR